MIRCNPMQVDESQAKAISHKDGPAMILAGPGSGKTTVITHRIRHMIQEYRIPPDQILVITFSKAAAKEMKERFLLLTHTRSTSVTFGTFHAIYFHILKCAYGYTASNIVKEEARGQFIREFIHRLRLEFDDEGEFVQGILGEISLIKNTGIDLANYYSSNCAEDTFRTIFRAYEEFLQQNRFLDFDDMLVYTKELFLARPDILAAWQRKYPYILIDEFQDINQIQYDIVRMLAQPKNNLFIVGDDDQSIYRFRGAQPEIMLHFEKDYPDTCKVLLDINYRCDAAIVEKAGNLIAHNKNRFPKNIRANTTKKTEPVTMRFPTQKEQNQFVIDSIQQLQKKGIPLSEIAILFRTNAQPGLLIQQLFSCNMPFVSKDHIPNLLDHWIVKDILTYLSLAKGDRSRASFLKIMNRPKRYLSRESLPYEKVSFPLWKSYYQNQHWVIQRLEKLEMDLKVLSQMRPYSAINYIRKAMDYESFLTEFAAYRKLPVEDLFDVLDEIQADAKAYASYEQWFAHLEEVRIQWQQQFQSKKSFSDAVQLSTLHGSKGLEFDTVFIVDVNETLMPYKKAILDPDLEEERRMFYVGMTRAKHRLYLLSSGQIHNKEMHPSRFLEESFPDCSYK